MKKQDWEPSEKQKRYWRSMRGKRGPGTPRWKGNLASKSAVHKWLETHYLISRKENTMENESWIKEFDLYFAGHLGTKFAEKKVKLFIKELLAKQIKELRAIEESCTDDKFGTMDTDLFASKVLGWMESK